MSAGNARGKCLAAVRAALRMRARMNDLNRYLERHFGGELRYGIGLHFGRAIVALERGLQPNRPHDDRSHGVIVPERSPQPSQVPDQDV